jgi:hypothetical protein
MGAKTKKVYGLILVIDHIDQKDICLNMAFMTIVKFAGEFMGAISFVWVFSAYKTREYFFKSRSVECVILHASLEILLKLLPSMKRKHTYRRRSFINDRTDVNFFP